MTVSEAPDTNLRSPDGDGEHPVQRRRGTGRVDVAKRTTNRWARWVHVYASMVAFVIVLFFGLTGITLNHPGWTFGDEVSTTTTTGEFAVDTTLDDGSINYLEISEYIRDNYGVSGDVDSFSETNGEVSIAYRNPGYAADLFVDVDTGEFSLTVEQQGWVAVVNDLHKGRDTGSAWKWVIDLSAGFLVLVSLTGLTMQFFLRKRRRSALTAAAAGGVVVVALIWLTLS